jgi:peptidoglycan lytic transglycosylase
MATRRDVVICAALGTALGLAGPGGPAQGNRLSPGADTPRQEAPASRAGPPRAAVDHSGREQRGRAAVFARELAGRRMADGGRFDPEASVAASGTLPLGTTARVTNLRNGQVAMVRVRDRIPGADGRILTVSPKVAGFLGMREDGVAPVVVAPLAVPQADGSVRLGAGTGLAGRRAYVTGRDRR